MAILKEDVVKSDQGFTKTIDEAGLGMVMDNLQRFQYQYPIKSTVREIASNAVDSHKERDIAKSILLGESVVGDYYVEKEGDLFEASKFNKDYYNLEHLSDESFVKIQYYDRDAEERDLIRIIDEGVGLGGSRLEGFFSLSYSTKRLNKSALGKFGIGAKAPLSTGVPSYRMVSVYNGQKYIFDIFSRHIQSIVDKWDEEGNDNTLHTFDNGYSFYSKKTDEKNGVTIELEVKKHQRSAYKEAVQNQLLYFTNIKFEIIHNYVQLVNEETEEVTETNSYIEQVPVTTQIVFENEDFIISNNYLFNKPHLVLGAEGSMVNYGLIDFKELELEPRTGNIGIKVSSEDIEITPSRETVVWSPQTRDVILSKFQKALETADHLVAEELKDDDILRWIDKNISIWSSNSGSNKVLKELSGMINKQEIKPKYEKDPNIRFGGPAKMLGYFGSYREVSFESKYVGGKYKTKVIRKDTGTWYNINQWNPLYISRGSMSARRDAYIKYKEDRSVIHILHIPELDQEDWIRIGATINSHIQINRETNERMGVDIDTDYDEIFRKQMNDKIAEYDKALLFLRYAKESIVYRDYDTVDVPDDWVDNIASQEELDNPNAHQQYQAPKIQREYVDHAARRKEEGKVFFKYAGFNTPYNHGYSYSDRNINSKSTNGAIFGWNQKEEYASVLNAFDGTLVYGLAQGKDQTLEESDELKLRMVAGLLLANTGVGPLPSLFDKKNEINLVMQDSQQYVLYPKKELYPEGAYVNRNVHATTDLMLLKVSKGLAKDLTHFIPVSRFLLDRDETKIFTHMKIINWFTAKQIYPILQKLQFLRKFEEISPFHAAEWKELYDMTNQYYFNGQDKIKDYPYAMQEAYVDTLDKLYKFQRWLVDEKPNEEEIAERSVEELGQPTNEVFVVDMDIIHRAEVLVEWAEPIYELLNNIPYFTRLGGTINEATNKEEFLDSIRFYLRSKSVEMIELAKQEAPEELDDYEEDEN